MNLYSRFLFGFLYSLLLLLGTNSCRSSSSFESKDYMRHMQRGGGDIMSQEFEKRRDK